MVTFLIRYFGIMILGREIIFYLFFITVLLSLARRTGHWTTVLMLEHISPDGYHFGNVPVGKLTISLRDLF